jgi:HlyD family secretion protein
MRNKVTFFLAIVGFLGALFSAYVYARPSKPLPPAFPPPSNPYPKGVFANGIVESYQSSGENTNVYPEVAAVVVAIHVVEGQHVTAGTPLVSLDDSVQRAITEQARAQAEAAGTMLQELRAEPRPENLAVSAAQVDVARANLKSANDTYKKQKTSYEISPESVSKETLDTAANSASAAQANLELATRQYDLAKAGAWIYDVRNQERQWQALVKAYASAEALLSKYVVRAQRDGIVMSIATAVGSYASPQGTYGSYTQGYSPVLVMGTAGGFLDVRCYIDEVLIPRLPPPDRMRAEMSVRGSSTKVPLQFVRVQPYVSPKIQLSNERQERVDLRVLPVIFRFVPPPTGEIYPGQLVDVYIGEK